MTNNEQQPQITVIPPIQIPPATMTVAQHDALIASMNVSKIIEDNKEKLLNAQMESLSNSRAASEPLPGIMDEVYDLEQNLLIKLENETVKIRKMVALDLTIFKLTDSPFYKLMMGDIAKEGEEVIKTMFPDEELFFNLVYQFINEVKVVYREVKKDKQAYHDNAVEEIGSKYSTSDLLKLVEGIFSYIQKIHGARISVTAPESGEDDKKKQ